MGNILLLGALSILGMVVVSLLLVLYNKITDEMAGVKNKLSAF